MLAYLEGMDAAATAEITGLSPGNVAVKIHRIKHLLAQHLNPKAQPAPHLQRRERDERALPRST